MNNNNLKLSMPGLGLIVHSLIWEKRENKTFYNLIEIEECIIWAWMRIKLIILFLLIRNRFRIICKQSSKVLQKNLKHHHLVYRRFWWKLRRNINLIDLMIRLNNWYCINRHLLLLIILQVYLVKLQIMIIHRWVKI